jgi:hypothetical protein
MNPIKKTKSQIYNISSKVSENGSYKSSVRVNLPDLNFNNSSIQNVYFSVLHCEVPNSFYIVNYTNNSIVVNSITYSIPVGNYNANTLITALLSLLPVGFAMSYSTITNKYTWTYSSNFTINASNANCKINSVIGLGNSDITSTSNTLILPYNVNFLPLPRLNFRSNILKFGNYNQNDNSSNLFLSLQNNAPQQGMINYINTTQIKFLIEDRAITSFLVTVTDDAGLFVNFNNIDWFLTFQIDIDFLEMPKNNNFSQLVNASLPY